MKNLVLFIFLFLISFNVCADVDARFIFENFSWEEYSENNSKLLEETGYRQGVQISSEYLKSKILTGHIDYDGQRQNGEPAQAVTDYLAINTEVINKYQIFNMGLGIDVWERRLAQGNLSQGGFNEYWIMTYGKVGVFYKFIGFDVVIPISCENNVHTLSLNPQPDLSPVLFLVFKYNDLFIGSEWEYIHFDKSEVEYYKNQYGRYQPESVQETISFFAGIKW